MGIENHSLRLLNKLKKDGIDFSHTLMIGRQEFIETEKRYANWMKQLGYTVSPEHLAQIFSSKPFYCEPLFKLLGAKQVDSMDFSDYEQATIVHDLNAPIPASLYNQFTCLYDGGTLEHIFNFPTSIANCMRMVKVGGHLITVTPANNLMGHGFYQFSPELYFRIFSKENGYEHPQIWLFDMKDESPFYRVKDPDEVKKRVMLLNDEMVYMAVVAKKIADVVPFQKPPLQSDYVSLWQEGVNKQKKKSELKAVLMKVMPKFLFNSMFDAYIRYMNLPKRGYIAENFTREDF